MDSEYFPEAWYMADGDECKDQKAENRCEPNRPCSKDDLVRKGSMTLHQRPLTYAPCANEHLPLPGPFLLLRGGDKVKAGHRVLETRCQGLLVPHQGDPLVR